MSNPGILIVAILALAGLYILLPRAVHIFGRYRDTRILPCPDTGAAADVSIDASLPPFTSTFGRPKLRATECSLWPERRDCAEGCLRHPDAEAP